MVSQSAKFTLELLNKEYIYDLGGTVANFVFRLTEAKPISFLDIYMVHPEQFLWFFWAENEETAVVSEQMRKFLKLFTKGRVSPSRHRRFCASGRRGSDGQSAGRW